MAKYTHYIAVPMTTSVNVVVETDEPLENGDDEKAYDLAMEVIEKAGTQFKIENEPGHTSDVEFGEEISFHKHLNRGNVCYAACPEIYWETEGDEEEEE